MKKLIAKLDKKADESKCVRVLARGRGINSLIKELAPLAHRSRKAYWQ